MRILLPAAIAASLFAGSLSTFAETGTLLVKDAACTKLKDEASCTPRTDCKWTPGKSDPAKGKCAKAPKPKTT